VRVAIGKLEGVESVTVSLEHGKASVRLRAGNRVTLSQLRQLVKNNGFNAGDAAVSVVGQLVQDPNGPALSVTGTDVVLMIAADQTQPSAYQQVLGKLSAGAGGSAVTLDGFVAAPQSKDARDRLVLQAVHPKDHTGSK
jgi:hypothetical protein